MPAAALRYIVEGGNSLAGSIHPSGNKNAALPIIAAALLTDQKVILENVPHIRDVETLVELIRSLGVAAEWTSSNALLIEAKVVQPSALDPELCARIRASILLAGPLLARCGAVTLPPPGGDVIGRRRVDTHFLALEQLGVLVELGEQYALSTRGLRGADVFLDEPSVTATENALMAASLATGTTTLRNAASEPHVQDLAHFLVALGASIEGIGTNTLTIHGAKSLHGATHRIGPDHIEVGSFIGLAAVTRSELRIVRAGVEHLRSTRMGFERLGIRCDVDGNDLVIPSDQEMRIQKDFGGAIPKLEDQPWPAFPADTM
ncbi:MAG: UDP-N-acetylglucosamine 1-carboxyvinyltransferase, partial [Gemmatimonadales bacterium]